MFNQLLLPLTWGKVVTPPVLPQLATPSITSLGGGNTTIGYQARIPAYAAGYRFVFWNSSGFYLFARVVNFSVVRSSVRNVGGVLQGFETNTTYRVRLQALAGPGYSDSGYSPLKIVTTQTPIAPYWIVSNHFDLITIFANMVQNAKRYRLSDTTSIKTVQIPRPDVGTEPISYTAAAASMAPGSWSFDPNTLEITGTLAFIGANGIIGISAQNAAGQHPGGITTTRTYALYIELSQQDDDWDGGGSGDFPGDEGYDGF